MDNRNAREDLVIVCGALMSSLIPDSSELQSILNKCHVFVDFLFSPAMYMRKKVKVLEEKKKK